MKKILFLLFFLPLSMGLFGQAKPPVNPAQVGSGLPADAGKSLIMDGNGRGSLGLTWNVGGNTLSANGIIGTTGAFDIIFRTNSIERLRIYGNGKIVATDSFSIVTGGEPRGITFRTEPSISIYNTGIGSLLTNPLNSIKLNWYNTSWNINSYRSNDGSLGDFGINNGTTDVIRCLPNGFIGIGILTPQYKLDLVGGVQRISNTGGGALIFNNSTNAKKWDFSQVGNDMYLNETGVQSSITMKAGGNVGIGVTTSAPTNRLHVFSASNPARLEGLQTIIGSSDFLLTADATGVVRQRTVANLFTSAPIQTLQQITDAGGGATTGGLSAATVTTSTVGTTTNMNFNVMRQNVSRLTLLSTESRYYATATHTFETDLLSDPTLRLKNFSNQTNLFVNDKFTNVTTANGDIVLTPTGIAMKVGTARKDVKFGQNARQNYRIKATLEIGGGGAQTLLIADTTALLRIYCNAGDESDAGNVTVYANLPTNPQNDAEIKVIAQKLFTSIVFQAGSGQTIANTATYYPLINDIYVLQFLSTTEGSQSGTWIIKKQ
jgi:hypothetical protein